jgi:predicted permease
VTDFWVPVTMQAELTRNGLPLEGRYYWSLDVLGRLKPGVSIAAAQASADLTFQRWLAEDPVRVKEAAERPVHIQLEPGATGMSPLRDGFREPLLVLMAGVALLLVIVCLNVAHLLLARAMKRQRELSIRTALGASRNRLLRQLLAEGVLLAALGAASGALFAGWLGDGLLSLATDGQWALPLSLDVGADRRVLGFTIALGVGTALLVGLVPAWQASRTNVQLALRATATAVAGGPRRLASRLLLTSQVAFSLVLLVGAGLLAGSLGKLRQVRTGLDEQHVLLVGLNTPVAGLSEPQARSLYDDIQRRVSALPGVRVASLSTSPVLDGTTYGWHMEFPGLSPQPKECCEFNLVTAGYFETLGMTVLRGRSLSPGDRAGHPRVAVVNQILARKVFGSAEAALGKHFRPAMTQEDIEIVGGVSDAQTRELREHPDPIVYWPVAQPHGLPVAIFLASLEVRAAGDPALLAGQVRAAVRDANPGVPVLGVRTLRSQVERTLLQDRLLATLSTAFGLAALFLVSIGLYGVISQWAAQRTSEIGVRMALGATAGGVRWLVLRQAFTLVLAGVAVGIPAAMAASRWLKSLLFGVTPIDPLTLAGASLALVTVAALAAYLPARRASRVDPMAALRSE